MNNDKIKEIVQKIFEEPVNPRAEGWQWVNTFAVSGLYAAGFDNAENLLVVSSNGQSITDTKTGKRLYQNNDENGYDERKLEAIPLNQPESPPVKMSGLGGGGLRTHTDDGWHLRIVYKDWPNGRLILQEPNTSLFGNKWKGQDSCVGSQVLATELEFRIWGFSESGNIMIWSDEVDIRIYRKSISTSK